MSNSGEVVVFEAMFHADSPGTNSFCCLIDKSECNGWSNKQWFGTKYCSFERSEELITTVKVTAPLWLLRSKGIVNLIVKV